MIENYLTLIWGEGALAGTKPGGAFFVNTGMGQTMEPLDMLEKRMIAKIGMAPIRPAKFIILQFSLSMKKN